jgi:hypothetical protein
MRREGFAARTLVVCLAAVFAFSPARALAQSSRDASLKVTVLDPRGRPSGRRASP